MTADQRDEKFIPRALAQYLRAEMSKEFAGQGPRGLVPYTETNFEEAMLFVEAKLSILEPEVRENLTVIVCQKMPGMIHLVYNPQEPVRFPECGCETRPSRKKK